MKSANCWGIYREQAHSPGRESDDARILEATSRALASTGYLLELKTPEAAVADLDQAPPRILLMCERGPILERLRHLERAGCVQINAPEAVLNTYRCAMIKRLRGAGIPIPRSAIVATASGVAQPPGLADALWVKRGDVHNTRDGDGDVTLVHSRGDMQAALGVFAARGIEHAIIQDHTPGDLIKFYGVGDLSRVPNQTPWFRWFYHRDQTLGRYPFEPAALAAVVQRAAAALGLEIYGGDAIVTPAARLFLIDINAWPSFALYRDEGATYIADYVSARFASARLSRPG